MVIRMAPTTTAYFSARRTTGALSARLRNPDAETGGSTLMKRSLLSERSRLAGSPGRSLGEPESDHPRHDERHAQEPQSRARLSEQDHSQQRRTHRTDAGPYRIGRSHRKRVQRPRQQI